MSKKSALSIGVAIDHRRRNRSEEGKALNIERLTDYKDCLVIFPKKVNKLGKEISEVCRENTQADFANH